MAQRPEQMTEACSSLPLELRLEILRLGTTPEYAFYRKYAMGGDPGLGLAVLAHSNASDATSMQHLFAVSSMFRADALEVCKGAKSVVFDDPDTLHYPSGAAIVGASNFERIILDMRFHGKIFDAWSVIRDIRIASKGCIKAGRKEVVIILLPDQWSMLTLPERNRWSDVKQFWRLKIVIWRHGDGIVDEWCGPNYEDSIYGIGKVICRQLYGARVGLLFLGRDPEFEERLFGSDEFIRRREYLASVGLMFFAEPKDDADDFEWDDAH